MAICDTKRKKEIIINMDISELPLVKKCMDKAAEYEAAGDIINAEKWLDFATKEEAYYAKQNYKTADELYKDGHGTS